jgi:hypothetical protein
MVETSTEYLVKTAFKPLTFLFKKMGNIINSQMDNLETNKTDILRKSIDNWRNNPNFLSKDLIDLRARNRELEDRMAGVDEQLAAKDL